MRGRGLGVRQRGLRTCQRLGQHLSVSLIISSMEHPHGNQTHSLHIRSQLIIGEAAMSIGYETLSPVQTDM
jgi:hypothetical protein